MTRLTPILVALVATSVAVASPYVEIRDSLITVPIARRVNRTGIQNVLARDQARARALIARGTEDPAKRTASDPVTNVVDTYVASVGVGNPPTTYSLLIDTGSSNTWVGAGKQYVVTKTSKSTGGSVSVSYGSGKFSGSEYTDTVTLSSGLVISGQSIGVASSSSGFQGVDGILGIGPVDLTQGTVSNVNTVPTVTDNLKSQRTLSTEVIGISYEPTTSDSSANGELTFGGTDSSKFSGSITYTGITSTSPAGLYWGINESIKYGSATILPSTAGIVDTGTTLILLATQAYNLYVKATGATPDQATGLLKITAAQYSALSNLNFVIGGTTFSMTPNAQIWPRSLNSAIGGDSNGIYLVVSDLGSPLGQGLDFINGYTFLERFYSVFDTTNKRVGFATTHYTNANTN